MQDAPLSLLERASQIATVPGAGSDALVANKSIIDVHSKIQLGKNNEKNKSWFVATLNTYLQQRFCFSTSGTSYVNDGVKPGCIYRQH